jgi:hypothetical protein
MNRLVFAPAAALLTCVLITSTAFAQAKPSASTPAAKNAPATTAPATTTPASSAPATPAKFYRPIKGTATVDFIQGPSTRKGENIVTVFKVKNTSAGSIGLLKIDEYWYDKKLKVVSGDTQAWRKPFNPGDIIELTLNSPYKADLYKSQYMFSHAGGDVKPTAVKKF